VGLVVVTNPAPSRFVRYETTPELTALVVGSVAAKLNDAEVLVVAAAGDDEIVGALGFVMSTLKVDVVLSPVLPAVSVVWAWTV
jgi:hypothetical protein